LKPMIRIWVLPTDHPGKGHRHSTRQHPVARRLVDASAPQGKHDHS
jgi:hypothetical protein